MLMRSIISCVLFFVLKITIACDSDCLKVKCRNDPQPNGYLYCNCSINHCVILQFINNYNKTIQFLNDKNMRCVMNITNIHNDECPQCLKVKCDQMTITISTSSSSTSFSSTQSSNAITLTSTSSIPRSNSIRSISRIETTTSTAAVTSTETTVTNNTTTATNSSTLENVKNTQDTSSGLIIRLAVGLGLAFIMSILIAFFVWKRRKGQTNQTNIDKLTKDSTNTRINDANKCSTEKNEIYQPGNHFYDKHPEQNQIYNQNQKDGDFYFILDEENDHYNINDDAESTSKVTMGNKNIKDSIQEAPPDQVDKFDLSTNNNYTRNSEIVTKTENENGLIAAEETSTFKFITDKSGYEFADCFEPVNNIHKTTEYELAVNTLHPAIQTSVTNTGPTDYVFAKNLVPDKSTKETTNYELAVDPKHSVPCKHNIQTVDSSNNGIDQKTDYFDLEIDTDYLSPQDKDQINICPGTHYTKLGDTARPVKDLYDKWSLSAEGIFPNDSNENSYAVDHKHSVPSIQDIQIAEGLDQNQKNDYFEVDVNNDNFPYPDLDQSNTNRVTQYSKLGEIVRPVKNLYDTLSLSAKEKVQIDAEENNNLKDDFLKAHKDDYSFAKIV